MSIIIVLSLILTGLSGLAYFGYRELVKRATACFLAWSNVLGQQQLLLDQIGILLETAGKYLPKTRLAPLFLAIRQLVGTPEDEIIAVGNHQMTLIDALRTLIDAGNDALPKNTHAWWIACQDTFISKIDDLILAQRHFNLCVTAYNNWRELLFVYWIADYLGYRRKNRISVP